MRRLVTVGAVAAVLVGTPGLAGAVGDFGSPHIVATAKCPPLIAVTNEAGATHGFVGCSDHGHLFYFHGSGTSYSWTENRVLAKPLAVADDGQSTFALGIKAGTNNVLLLVRRRHSGGTTVTRISRHVNATTSAGLVARDGKWWAVWDEATQSSTNALFEAKTMGGSRDRHRLNVGPGMPFNTEPTLALRPGGGVALAWHRFSNTDRGDTWVGMNGGSGWNFRLRQAGVDHPSITRVGNRLALIVTDGVKADGSGKACLRLWASGQWSAQHCFTKGYSATVTGADKPLVAESNGKIFVAWSHASSTFSFSGFIAERTKAGTWSEAKISGRHNESVAVLGASHGKAIVLLVRDGSPEGHLVLRRQS